MRPEEIQANYLKKVLSPKGYGVLAGMKLTERPGAGAGAA